MLKKFLSSFLAVIICFTAVCRPFAYAAEIETVYEQYGIATTSLSATLALGTAGGGAIAAGSGAIAASALPVLAFVITAGLLFYTVDGLCNTVSVIWDMLPDIAKEECVSIVESGEDSFTASPELAAELNNAINELFFVDGVFVGDQTFDFASAIPYSSTSAVSGNDLSFDNPDLSLFYRTTGGSSTWQKLASGFYSATHTGIYFSQANKEVNGRYQQVFSFSQTNGINGYFVESTFSLADSTSTWYAMSDPVVRYENVAGASIPLIGFWVLEVCELLQAGRTCTHGNTHTFVYQSHYVGESLDNESYIVLNNTGIDVLDGNPIKSQSRNKYGSYDLVLNNTVDGYNSVRLGKTALAYALASAGALALDGVKTNDYEEPDDKLKIFLPPTDVLNEINNLTQNGTRTNDWSQTVDEVLEGVSTGTDTGVDSDTAGFWQTLWNWLQKIFNGILAIPQAIIDGITVVLEYLFVPDLTGVQELVDVYSHKFNWVSDLYVFFEDFVDRLTCNEPPKIPINLDNAESKYDWGGETYVLDMSWYARYKDSVDTILSGILWIFFLWRLFRRIPDIISGVGINEEIPVYRTERTISKPEGSVPLIERGKK